jgi:hypothetical protein
MTRKDYIVLADALRLARSTSATDEMVRGVDGAVEFVCVSLKRDNTRFNKHHFLAVVRGEKDLNSRPSRNGGAK